MAHHWWEEGGRKEGGLGRGVDWGCRVKIQPVSRRMTSYSMGQRVYVDRESVNLVGIGTPGCSVGVQEKCERC